MGRHARTWTARRRLWDRMVSWQFPPRHSTMTLYWWLA